ncbi:heparinase II/III domain-containing protein [Xanthobacter flavus]|uniref:heparinase II/III domain-containing protein n=1 Tax=Xanthobacter flavus TaxID=281 RepID=UPI0037269D49
MAGLSKAVRLYETVRHLSAEQWLFRAICRGQRVYRQKCPVWAFRALRAAAEELPLPNLAAPALARTVAIAEQLQTSIHKHELHSISQGSFTFLNRTVDFGSIEAVHWRRDLGERNNPLWRMNFAYFGWAVPLAATGEYDKFQLILNVLRSLEQQNGFEQPGVFRDVWNAYSASHRLINLLSAIVAYIKAGGKFLQKDEIELLDHIRFCAVFVHKSLERDLQYNHLLKNYVALAVYASAQEVPTDVFPGLGSGIRSSVAQQFLLDGGHAERSPMYHLLSVLDLRTILASGAVPECEAELKVRLAAAEAALAVMSHPDGDIALFNDSWLGEGPPASHVITAGVREGRRTLEYTGYTQLRAADAAVIVDHGLCGPDDNPGHAHADFLSLELSIHGRRFFVDPGVPTYSAGEARDRSRSARFHNGPYFSGYEPIDFWASFRVGRRGRARSLDIPSLAKQAPLSIAGSHNGFAGIGGKVGRWVGLWPGVGVLVVDVWCGAALSEAFTTWLIPDQFVQIGELDFSADATHVGVRALRGAVTSETGSWWPRFGFAQNATLLSVRPTRQLDLQAAALWVQWGTGDRPTSALVDRIVATLGGAL